MSLRLRFTLLVIGLLAALVVPAGIWRVGVERKMAKDRILRTMEVQAPTHARGLRRLDPADWPLDDAVASVDVIHGGHVQIDYYAPTHDFARVGSVHTHERLAIPRQPVRHAIGTLPLSIQRVDGRSFFAFEWHGPPGRDGRGPQGREGRGRRPRDEHGHAGPLWGYVYFERGPALASVGFDVRVYTTWIAGLAVLLFGGGLAWLLSTAMVGPVRKTAEAAESISLPEERLPEPGTQDELGRLVVVLNSMLGRLDASARRERDFLAAASHELRRPLAALRAELELAQRGERSKEALEQCVELALGDVRVMGRLIDDMLLHARASIGRAVGDEKPVDLVEMITEAVSRGESVAGDDVHILVGEIPDVTVTACSRGFGHVIENLVLDGIARGGAGARIHVSARREGEGLAIEVVHDGPAIPEDLREQVFEAFVRGDATPGDVAGLGLTAAREIVHAHDATIRMDSPIDGDRGTGFTVVLPGNRVSPR